MKEETKDKLMAAFAWFAVLLAIVAMCLPLGGCSAPREIEKVYITDTLYQNKVVHDSVDRWHTHYEVIEGSTKYVYDTFYTDRWHLNTDTVYKTNVVTETATKVVEVEKKVYVWWPCIVVIVIIIGSIIYIWYKNRRK